MKIILLIAAFVCCALAAPTTAPDVYREELIKRGEALEARVQKSIAKLIAEDRGHLAAELKEEETRVEALINELKTTSPGPEALRLLEEEIVRVEDRVTQEEKFIEKETQTQDELLKDAKILQNYVTLELAVLANVTGPDREKAQLMAKALRKEEHRLEQMCQELINAQTPRRIAELEVEVRVIEVHIVEILRYAHFVPPTPAPGPVTPGPTHSMHTVPGTVPSV